MIGKSLLALLAAPFLMSNTERGPEYDTAPILVDVPGIFQVMCKEGSGTAFRNGTYEISSANHVTSLTDCGINGEPLVKNASNKELDFSTGWLTQTGPQLKVSCEGFKPGEDYAAIGFARGTTPYMRATVVQLAPPEVAAMFPWDSFTVFVGEGRFIPGQSGAPVFKVSTGEVVGIVKGYRSLSRISYARSLADTPLCTGRM